jgi:hypothetical protein
LQQRLVKTRGRLIKHARYYWLLLAESHLTRRLFGSMVRRKAGGKPVYTEYSGVGHNVARWAYTEPALPEWLFAQRR